MVTAYEAVYIYTAGVWSIYYCFLYHIALFDQIFFLSQTDVLFVVLEDFFLSYFTCANVLEVRCLVLFLFLESYMFHVSCAYVDDRYYFRWYIFVLFGSSSYGMVTLSSNNMRQLHLRPVAFV